MSIRDYKRFFIFGLARSGQAAARLLVRNGYDVALHDGNADIMAAALADPVIAEAGDRVQVAGADDAAGVLGECDCMILSPGIRVEAPLVQHARGAGIPVAGEVELAFHFTEATIIGITGTNGKSTTTKMAGDILAAAGRRVEVAGNIGTALSDAVARGPEVIVVELSSFQLDTIDTFRCDVAALLNVTPDHLDRYGNSFDNYLASKARIANGATADSVLVYNADDAAVSGIAASYPGRTIPFSSTTPLDNGVCLNGVAIISTDGDDRHSVMPLAEFTPVGTHNLENAMAAIGIGHAAGVEDGVMRAALGAYRPLPHRMEMVRVHGGVAFINDSKATNVDAAIKSIESIDGRVVVILGGRDKDGNFAAMRDRMKNVRAGVLIGEAAEKIARALDGVCPFVNAADMPDAVNRAVELAGAGDTVLLAPACASFDMFGDFEERGRVFRVCVNALGGGS